MTNLSNRHPGEKGCVIMTRHPGEGRDPGPKHNFKAWFTTWIPAFAGMTIIFLNFDAVSKTGMTALMQ